LRKDAARIGFRISKVLGSDLWRVRAGDGSQVFAADTARVEAFIREQADLLGALMRNARRVAQPRA
jgi:hypothetical protein